MAGKKKTNSVLKRAPIPAAIKSHLKKRMSVGLWEAARVLFLELRLSRIHHKAIKKAPSFWRVEPVRLNLGSGPNPKANWVNIDLFDLRGDLQLDLREPWPFADNTVSYIYSEHVFEHFEFHREVPSFLSEAFRVLKSGGIFDVVVPDAEAALKAYGDPDATYWSTAAKDWHPDWCQTELDHINFLFRQDGEHKYAWDAETLAMKLKAAGFIGISKREFDPLLDQEARRADSLYMLASKP